MALQEESEMTPSPKTTRWTKRDYKFLALAMLIKFGDAVEMYMPGVITQKVSCELDVSFFQEGTLSIIFYIFMGIALLVAVPLTKKIGEKNTLLCSMYGSIIFTIFCSLVPNYYTFLLSRALIGFGCGLNATTIGVFGANNISSYEILATFSFIHECIAFTFGCAWAPLLGWLLLETLGWRLFVLLTSIPLFIVPIFMLHCCIDEEGTATESTSLLQVENESQSVENFPVRVLKASLFGGFSYFIGYGSIMLLPSLIRNFNLPLESEYVNHECEEVVHGDQYMILAAVNGLANILGRPIGFFVRPHFKFMPLQTTFMLGFAISYGIILAKPGLLVESIMMGIGKLCYSMQGAELSILHYDVDYFGLSGLSLGGSLMFLGCTLGTVISTTLAVFINPYHVVIAGLVVSLAQVGVILSFSERK